MEETETGTGPKTLGLERWVQFAFIAAALFLFWFLDNLVWALWNIFAAPDDTLIAAGSAIVAIVTSYVCYKTPQIHGWANEVAGELSKVTWPSRRETWSNTVVVIITSIIAATILGIFDAAWSAVTDLIYKV